MLKNKDIISPVKLLTLNAWGIAFHLEDHKFLHHISIFDALYQLLSHNPVDPHSQPPLEGRHQVSPQQLLSIIDGPTLFDNHNRRRTKGLGRSCNKSPTLASS